MFDDFDLEVQCEEVYKEAVNLEGEEWEEI